MSTRLGPSMQPAPAEPKRGPRALATSAAVMASGTLVSRVLGLVRNALLVAVVGALGTMADAWSVANKLPNIISMLLAGGILNAVLVPQVVRAMRRKDGGEEHVNRLLTAAIAILLGITVVLTAAASLLITLYAASFPAEWKAVAVALAYWCIPQLFFYGLYTLLGQVLNARSIFGPYMWAPAINNVVAIAGLVAFLVLFGGLPDGGLSPGAWTSGRITLLAGTATLGVVAQALVLVIPLHRSGFRFRPVWGVRGHGLGKASTVATWAFAALAVGQLGYLAVSNVAAAASSVGGDVAGNFAYDNAFLVFMLPQSLVTVSLVTALFTRVSHNAAARDGAKVRDDLSFGMRTLGVFTVLATAAFTVLAVPLVQIVTLDRAPGGFSDYRAIGAVLVAMAFGLVAMGVWTMVQRVFYAYEDTRTLFRIQVPMAVILAGVALLGWWLLDPQWWVVGTGVATTVSNSVGALVGYLATRKYLPNLDGARVLRTHLRVVLAAIPPALAAWGLLHLWGVESSFWGAVLRVVVLGTVIVGGYLFLIRALRVAELNALLVRVRGPLNRVLRLLPGRRGDDRAPSTMSTYGGLTGRGDEDVTTDSSVTLRSGEVLIERFRLDRPLPAPLEGTAVWAATDTALDVPVRVLTVEGPQRDDAIDAARRAALVDDPRLLRVLRAGIEGGQGFVVTEPLQGVTLAELAAGGPLPPSQARALVGGAAAALETARRRGVHHLALRPSSLVRTDDGEVRLVGLGTDAAWLGVEVPDAAAAARRDAVGLVHLLYTALTGTWPGAPEHADGLPTAPEQGDAVAPAGDVVENVPNDLDTLCAVTLGEHDDGPFTPGELVADLAPWGPIDVTAPAALPPVVRPGSVAEASGAAEPAADEAAEASTTTEAASAENVTAAPAVPSAPRPPVRISAIDTSAWAPHPLPAVSEPTPFADLVTDTGSIPAYTRPLHAATAARPVTSAALPMDDPEATAVRDPEATAVRDVAAAAPLEETRVREAIEETQVREAPAPGPDASGTGPVVPAVSTAVDPEAAQQEAEQTPEAVSIAGLPTLTRHARGWDVPGGEAPERLPAPPMQTGADDALETDPEPAAAAVTGAGAAVRGAFAPLRETNRVINEVGGKVSGGARGLIGGAGERLGSLTQRAGAFVDDVREEFRPVVDEDDPDERSRFNPAPIVLCVMVALVIFGLVMAVLTLKDASTSFTPGPPPGAVDPTPAETTQVPTEEPSSEAPAQEEDPEGPPAASRVEITDGVTFDPTVSGGENQDSAYLAYDGNPDTTWNSLRYNSPTYGMKSGLGYTVVLDETALVSSVTLDVNGQGGMVEIRLGDPNAPNQGAVLASGAMGSSVTYTFSEPVEAEAISLWFPELPVADSDGRNRIELAEITLG